MVMDSAIHINVMLMGLFFYDMVPSGHKHKGLFEQPTRHHGVIGVPVRYLGGGSIVSLTLIVGEWLPLAGVGWFVMSARLVGWMVIFGLWMWMHRQ